MSEPEPARREAISVLQNTDGLTDSLSVGKQCVCEKGAERKAVEEVSKTQISVWLIFLVRTGVSRHSREVLSKTITGVFFRKIKLLTAGKTTPHHHPPSTGLNQSL